MKKAFLGALASLMLAGAISAASGLTTANSATQNFIAAGDGAPLALSAKPSDSASDVSVREN